MLRPYLKIWEWEWIFGRAVKTIFSPGVRSPCLFSSLLDSIFYHLILPNNSENIIERQNLDYSKNSVFCFLLLGKQEYGAEMLHLFHHLDDNFDHDLSGSAATLTLTLMTVLTSSVATSYSWLLTGKSLSKALILQNMGRTCCVHKLF